MHTQTLQDVTLCGARSNHYDFKGRDGRQVVGVSYFAYFVNENPMGQPQEVKVSEAEYQRLTAAGFGTGVTVECEIGARNDQVIFTATNIMDAHTGEVLRAVG